jgi:hypothetical protein
MEKQEVKGTGTDLTNGSTGPITVTLAPHQPPQIDFFSAQRCAAPPAGLTGQGVA